LRRYALFRDFPHLGRAELKIARDPTRLGGSREGGERCEKHQTPSPGDKNAGRYGRCKVPSEIPWIGPSGPIFRTSQDRPRGMGRGLGEVSPHQIWSPPDHIWRRSARFERSPYIPKSGRGSWGSVSRCDPIPYWEMGKTQQTPFILDEKLGSCWGFPIFPISGLRS